MANEKMYQGEFNAEQQAYHLAEIGQGKMDGWAVVVDSCTAEEFIQLQLFIDAVGNSNWLSINAVKKLVEKMIAFTHALDKEGYTIQNKQAHA